MTTPKEIRKLAELVGSGQINWRVSATDSKVLKKYLMDLGDSTRNKVVLPGISKGERLNIDLWNVLQKPEASLLLGGTSVVLPEDLDAFSFPPELVKKLKSKKK